MAANGNRKRRTENYNKGEGEDRLSSLPEPIIVEILSFLPLKSAISTSALSTQWRFLWTQVTSIEIDSTHFDNISECLYIINGFLPRLTSPDISKFSLSLDHFSNKKRGKSEDRNNFQVVESWLRFVCDRNIKELQVSHHGCWIPAPPPPPFVYQTQSLVSLEMYLRFGYKLPVGATFKLKNLKRLKLEVRPDGCDSLTELIESCTALEDLDLGVYPARGYRIDLSCHNLKRFVLRLTASSLDGMNTKVTIDAPKLEYLNAKVYDPSTFWLVNKPIIKLLKAAGSSGGRTCLSNQLCGGICNVQSLVLEGLEFDPSSTLFRNLTHLRFGFSGSLQCDKLMALLHCCPVLEVLFLTLKDGNQMSWIPPHAATSSSCVLTRLRRVEIHISIHELRFVRDWVNLVMYMISRTPVLERLIFGLKVTQIGRAEFEQRELHEELLLCKELYECPRSSLHSQIEYYGEHLRVSGDGKEVKGRDGSFLPLL